MREANIFKSEGAAMALSAHEKRLRGCEDCGSPNEYWGFIYGKCEKCFNKHYGHKKPIKKIEEPRGESFKQWIAKIIAKLFA